MNFSALKLPIIGALLLASVGISAAVWVSVRSASAEAELTQAQAVAQASRAKLEMVFEERRQISDFLPRYNHLKSIGALGAEQRLAWVERLNEAREAVAFPRFAFSIAARAPRAAPVDGAPTLMASRMRLELGLTHEGELLAYLRRLRDPPVGMMRIQSCSLKRVEADARRADGSDAGASGLIERVSPMEALRTARAQAAAREATNQSSNPSSNSAAGQSVPLAAAGGNLSAECVIDWLTLAEPTPAAAEPVPPSGAPAKAARGGK